MLRIEPCYACVYINTPLISRLVRLVFFCKTDDKHSMPLGPKLLPRVRKWGVNPATNGTKRCPKLWVALAAIAGPENELQSTLAAFVLVTPVCVNAIW